MGWLGNTNVEWCLVREARREIVVLRDRDSAASWFRGKSVALWGCGALGCRRSCTAHAFFKKHGQNADRKMPLRGVSRKAVRVHIRRIRDEMAEVFHEAGLAAILFT